MKRCRVNDYDMAYIEMGSGAPMVLVHGSLSDFRIWSPVLGPLSRDHRLIAVSLRHYFPEHWNGQGGSFTIAQHVSDMIAFLESMELGPVNLVGHSRGGHIAFRVAQQRPDLIKKLVLAEPGGELDSSLQSSNAETAPAGMRVHVQAASELIHAGDIDGGLRTFKDAIDGEGAWMSLPAAERQLRRDNAFTLLAQTNEQRKPYARIEAEGISVPTLLVGGADTPGLLPIILHALTAHIPGARSVIIPDATHVMFVQQPDAFCAAVLDFVANG